MKVKEDANEQPNTKWKRLFNAVATAQNRQGDGRPLLRLVGEVMQPVRFQSPVEFENHRAEVNERLLLSGYLVREDGKVARVSQAATLSAAQERASLLYAELARRDVHPDVLKFCRVELVQQNYFHAVLEAAKSVAERLRSLSGLQSDGASLVDSACSLSSGPVVAFNSLSTEWERSEQTGLATLLKGLFGTFRNPTAHAPKVLWATSRRDALDMLTVASMLHRRLDGAIVHRH
ncbi:hypothetical protein AYJ66_16840 [Dietzia cinnamea]|nr:hypothetical protein AYJ66_16840 [Dietzia cinnamea]